MVRARFPEEGPGFAPLGVLSQQRLEKCACTDKTRADAIPHGNPHRAVLSDGFYDVRGRDHIANWENLSTQQPRAMTDPGRDPSACFF